MNRFFVIAILGVIASACSNKVEENKLEEKNTETKTAVTDPVKPKTVVAEPEGIVGVIEVPEILTLAVKDSATIEEAPFKVGKAYSIIESDIKELKLEYKNEPPGALYYTNDPKKLVFECVIPINKMPATTPKHST